VVGDSPIPDLPSRDLVRFSRIRGLTARYIPLSRFAIIVGNDGLAISIRGKPAGIDGVFLRSLGLFIDVEQFFYRTSLLRSMQDLGVEIINTVDGLLRTRNKMETLLVLSKRGIRVPRTLVTEDLLNAYGIMKQWGDAVIKPIQGSRGFGSVRLTDADIAFQVMKTLLTFRRPIYLQEYIEKPSRDIRIMVIDGQVFGCMYRISTNGNWKTNIAQGASGVACDSIDPELAEISIKSVEALGLTYGGVDVGESKAGYVIFEVNGSPDWQELTAVTNKNPADELVRVMMKRLAR